MTATKTSEQNRAEYVNALRQYEAAHAVHMRTGIFHTAERQAEVKRNLDIARRNYEAAYKAANPTHILM